MEIFTKEILPLIFLLISIIFSCIAVNFCVSEEEALKDILLDPIGLFADYIVIIIFGLYYALFFPWKSVSVLIVIIFTLLMPIYPMYTNIANKIRVDNKESVKIPPHKQKYIKRNKKRR